MIEPQALAMFRQHDYNDDGYLEPREFEPLAHVIMEGNVSMFLTCQEKLMAADVFGLDMILVLSLPRFEWVNRFIFTSSFLVITDQCCIVKH